MPPPIEQAAPGEGASPARAAMPVRWGLIALLVGPYVATPFALALAGRSACAEAFTAEGPSMEPTLHDGDLFLVDKTAFSFRWVDEAEARVRWAAPEVGDVVVLRSPLDGLDLVKRVVAVAGQRVEVREDGVYVDGVALGVGAPRACPRFPSRHGRFCEERDERVGERAWSVRITDPHGLTPMAERLVPDDHVFVLGDHRDRSNDSRHLGPIPVPRISGRARFVVVGRTPYAFDAARSGALIR